MNRDQRVVDQPATAVYVTETAEVMRYSLYNS